MRNLNCAMSHTRGVYVLCCGVHVFCVQIYSCDRKKTTRIAQKCFGQIFRYTVVCSHHIWQLDCGCISGHFRPLHCRGLLSEH